MKIKELTLECSHKCNYNCIHCSSGYVSGLIKPKKVIELVELYDPETIRYSGGEPFWYLTHEHYKYPLDFEDRRLIVTTSGQYQIETIRLENKFNEIRLSIYGYSQFHDAVTGVAGSFDKVYKLTKDLVNKRGKKDNGITITSPIWNHEQSSFVLNIARELDVNYRLTALVPNTININLHGNTCSTGSFECVKKDKILVLPNGEEVNCAVEKRGFDCYYKHL